ncbi:cytidine deaminase [soil metagenome]
MKISDDIIVRLLRAAKTAQRRAYAPYSNFHVGAAIYTQRGRIISGCNVENASFGLTNCAERLAIGRIVVEGAGTPLVCVVVGPKPQPLTPCGACRQVLLEFNPELVVISFGSNGSRLDCTIQQLLPSSFNAGDLTAVE